MISAIHAVFDVDVNRKIERWLRYMSIDLRDWINICTVCFLLDAQALIFSEACLSGIY